MMYDNPDLHAYGVIQLLTYVSGGERLVFREETCSGTSLTAALTRAGYRLPLDHQFSEAVDIKRIRLCLLKEHHLKFRSYGTTIV